MSENAIPGAPDQLVRVFVSYAREDRRWLDPDHRYSLIPFLKESLRRHKVAFWFDEELKPGDEFRQLIESEIDQSQIALLIVSQSFLNSEFIESREMPRIAERAQRGQMIVVPVLIEPCDWSEYPFLADRQMVPSSPLIEYTESEVQWTKIRFQILDGLKAQLKRIREVPQSSAAAALNARDIPPEEEPTRAARNAEEQEAADREAAAQAALLAEQEAKQIRQQREHEAEERRRREEAREEQRLREAAEREAAAQAALRAKKEAEQVSQRQEDEARPPLLVPQPGTKRDASRCTSSGPRTEAPEPVLVPAAIPEPAKAQTENAPEVSDISEPTEVPILEAATAPLEMREEWTRIQSQASAVERKKARIPRKWMIAIAGGATLVIALVVVAIFMGRTIPTIPWTVRYTGKTQILRSIFGTSDGQHLWVVGNDWQANKGMILVSDDKGETWSTRNSGTNSVLESIFGTSDGQRLWAVGGEGTILESDDMGATWMARNSGTTLNLYSIFGTSDGNRLWAVGGDPQRDHGTIGSIVESDNGGASWTERNSGTKEDLRSVFGTSDGRHLWVVGMHGTILESDDGGATWTARNSGTINSVFGTSDGKRLWAVGEKGTFLESDDGGAFWKARSSGTTDGLFPILGTSDGEHLWVGTNSHKILESEDGGETWTARNSREVVSICSIVALSDGKRLWAVGANRDDDATILESDR